MGIIGGRLGRGGRPGRRTSACLVVAQVALLLSGGVAVATHDGADEYCPEAGGERQARAILECLRPSTAYIKTPTASGTGLLLADGHILTNAHVLDPHGSATVTLGDERHEDVPLVGVDQLADIALLGPIETAATPITIGDPSLLVQGDPVFLVGFPGEREDEPEPAISQGILSRVRSPKSFGLTYLQTDASIGGGQSGGALVDATGRVVGVSGLSFADNFALALHMPDVRRSMKAIRAGEADDHTSWPMPDDGLSTFIESTGYESQPIVLAVPTSAEERTIDVTIEGTETYVAAFSYEGMELGVSQNWIDLTDEFADELSPEELASMSFLGANGPGVVAQNGPNAFSVTIPADSLVVLSVIPMMDRFVSPAALTTTVKTSEPVMQVELQTSPDRVTVGEKHFGTLDSLEASDLVEVELQKGQQVEIYLGSPASDMVFALRAPSQDWFDATIADDSDRGLYGLDAELRYTAPEDGIYEIEIGKADPIATGYLLEITDV